LILVLMEKKNGIRHMSYLMRHLLVVIKMLIMKEMGHKLSMKSLIKMRVIYTLLEKGDPVRFELGMQFASKALVRDLVKDLWKQGQIYSSRKIMQLGWL